MVPTTVDLPFLVEVDEVHQQLVTHAAHEAARVPTHAVARPRRKHCNVTSVYLPPTLRDGQRQRWWRGEMGEEKETWWRREKKGGGRE